MSRPVTTGDFSEKINRFTDAMVVAVGQPKGIKVDNTAGVRTDRSKWAGLAADFLGISTSREDKELAQALKEVVGTCLDPDHDLDKATAVRVFLTADKRRPAPPTQTIIDLEKEQRKRALAIAREVDRKDAETKLGVVTQDAVDLFVEKYSGKIGAALTAAVAVPRAAATPAPLLDAVRGKSSSSTKGNKQVRITFIEQVLRRELEKQPSNKTAAECVTDLMKARHETVDKLARKTTADDPVMYAAIKVWEKAKTELQQQSVNVNSAKEFANEYQKQVQDNPALRDPQKNPLLACVEQMGKMAVVAEELDKKQAAIKAVTDPYEMDITPIEEALKKYKVGTGPGLSEPKKGDVLPLEAQALVDLRNAIQELNAATIELQKARAKTMNPTSGDVEKTLKEVDAAFAKVNSVLNSDIGKVGLLQGMDHGELNNMLDQLQTVRATVGSRAIPNPKTTDDMMASSLFANMGTSFIDKLKGKQKPSPKELMSSAISNKEVSIMTYEWDHEKHRLKATPLQDKAGNPITLTSAQMLAAIEELNKEIRERNAAALKAGVPPKDLEQEVTVKRKEGGVAGKDWTILTHNKKNKAALTEKFVKHASLQATAAKVGSPTAGAGPILSPATQVGKQAGLVSDGGSTRPAPPPQAAKGLGS